MSNMKTILTLLLFFLSSLLYGQILPSTTGIDTMGNTTKSSGLRYNNSSLRYPVLSVFITDLVSTDKIIFLNIVEQNLTDTEDSAKTGARPMTKDTIYDTLQGITGDIEVLMTNTNIKELMIQMSGTIVGTRGFMVRGQFYRINEVPFIRKPFLLTQTDRG